RAAGPRARRARAGPPGGLADLGGPVRRAPVERRRRRGGRRRGARLARRRGVPPARLGRDRVAMSILDSVLAALGGGTLGVIATAAAKRGASRDASAARVVEPLLARIDTLERGRDADRAEMRQAHESYMHAMQAMRDGIDVMRERDAQACREETARQVREAEERTAARLAAVAHTALTAHEETGREDDTQVRMTRAIVRRTPTPPGGVPAQPERRGELVPRREIPPPRRGKGD